MKVPSEGAPQIFCRFSCPKSYEKFILLVTVAIVEMFASLVPRHMQIVSIGDGLEDHFQAFF